MRATNRGCSKVSPPAADAAPGTAGTATRVPIAASSGGACCSIPAWMSNAAPTPSSAGAPSASACAAIQRSCLGVVSPTHTRSGARGVDHARRPRPPRRRGGTAATAFPPRRGPGTAPLRRRPAARHALPCRRRSSLPAAFGGAVPARRASGRGRRRASIQSAPARWPHHTIGMPSGVVRPEALWIRTQLGVALALHHAVHAGDAHVLRARRRRSSASISSSAIGHVDRADADAQHVDAADQPAVAPRSADRRARTCCSIQRVGALASPSSRSIAGSQPRTASEARVVGVAAADALRALEYVRIEMSLLAGDLRLMIAASSLIVTSGRCRG